MPSATSSAPRSAPDPSARPSPTRAEREQALRLCAHDGVFDPLLALAARLTGRTDAWLWIDAPDIALAGTPGRADLTVPVGDDGTRWAHLSVGGPVPGLPSPAVQAALAAIAALLLREADLHRANELVEREQQHISDESRFFLASRDLTLRIDDDGRMLDLGARWSEVLGYPLLTLLGASFLDLMHPADVGEARAGLRRLAEGQPVDGLRTRCRTDGAGYRTFVWSAVPSRPSRPGIYARAIDVTEVVRAEADLTRSRSVLDAIRQAQRSFTTDGGDATWWAHLLESVLDLTGSGYGFIGRVGHDDAGAFLRTEALTDISWDEATRALYDAHARDGLVFRNMDTLFGRAIVEGAAVIANDVANDPRAGGRPDGHPPLHTFAGLPLLDERTMVGLVGLANRPGGYDPEIVDAIQPVLTFAAAMMRASDAETRRREAVAELRATQALQRHILDSSEAASIAVQPDGRVAFANRASHRLLDIHDPDQPMPARLAHWFGQRSLTTRLQTMLEEGVPEHLEEVALSVQDPEGSEVVVRLQARVLRLGAEPGLLLTLHDRSRELQLQATRQANQRLEAHITELRRARRQNEVLGECIELLQSALDLDEAVSVLHEAAPRLFRAEQVTLYVAFPPEEALVRLQTERPLPMPTDTLNPHDCWALRSHRVHLSGPGHRTPVCAHVADPSRPHACVPIRSMDRTVALVSLQLPEPAPAADGQAHQSWYTAAAHSLSSALATVTLRASLQDLAHRDDATELLNRRGFLARVAQLRARPSGRAVMARLDVEHYAALVDQQGYLAGDRALHAIARALEARSRPSDALARLGGQAFALYLHDCPPDEAQRRLGALRDAVVHVGSRQRTPLGAALAWVVVDADTGGTEHALARADEALAEARRSRP